MARGPAERRELGRLATDLRRLAEQSERVSLEGHETVSFTHDRYLPDRQAAARPVLEATSRAYHSGPRREPRQSSARVRAAGLGLPEKGLRKVAQVLGGCPGGTPSRSRRKLTMLRVSVPGGNTCSIPCSRRAAMSSSGITPPPTRGYPARRRPATAPRLRETTRGAPRETREPDRVDVLLDRGERDLRRRLPQPGVDHLEAGIA